MIRLICPLLEPLCNAMESVDQGECVKMEHAIISDLLLGLIKYRAISDRKILETAEKGVLHAVGVAGWLAKKHNRYAVVAITNSYLSGIVAIASPTRNGRRTASICGVDMGILVDCDRPHVMRFWPNSGRRTRIMLVDPDVLVARAKYLVSLRSS